MVLDKVREILAEQLDVNVDEISESTNIVEDLGADSLDIVDIVMTLEDEFDVEIPDDDIEGLQTVQQLVDYLEEKAQ